MSQSAVLLTRPLVDSQMTAAALSALGIESVIAPLIDIEPRDETPSLAGVQATLITSANGVRALALQTAVRNVPVFAVGDASALVARELGFETVESAGGNVDDLAALVQQKLKYGAGKLLHPAGSVLAGDLAALLSRARFDVRRYVAYASRAVAELPQAARLALRDGEADMVLFYSPRTAAIFRDLVTRAELTQDCRFLDALCLSEAVAKMLKPLEFRDIRVAEQPDQQALFALIVSPQENSP